MKITLTFDNGPTADVTRFVLAALARHGVKATFFMLGRQLAQRGLSAVAREVGAQGHRIGNHGYYHETPFGEMRDIDAAVSEIVRTQTLIGDLASEPRLFRPFGGGGHLDDRLFNAAAVKHLADQNYTAALWTSVPRDWEDPAGWVERAVNDCVAEPWSVVVLHDIATGAMERLDDFLVRLTAMGAEFSQDFPETATPMIAGRIGPRLHALTAPSRLVSPSMIGRAESAGAAG